MNITIGPTHLKKDFTFTIPEVNKIGIFMSGGIDSSAMLSLILKELKETNRLDSIPITAFTLEKTTGETIYAARILNIFKQHFQVDITHVNNIPNSEEAIRKGRMDPNIIAETSRKFNSLVYLSGNNMPSPEIKSFNGSLDIYKHRYINSLF